MYSVKTSVSKCRQIAGRMLKSKLMPFSSQGGEVLPCLLHHDETARETHCSAMGA